MKRPIGLAASLLIIAVNKRKPDVADALIIGGAGVNARDTQNRKALSLARAIGGKEINEARLSHGATSRDENS